MNSKKKNKNDLEIRKKALEILEQWEKDLIQSENKKEMDVGDRNQSNPVIPPHRNIHD